MGKHSNKLLRRKICQKSHSIQASGIHMLTVHQHGGYLIVRDFHDWNFVNNSGFIDEYDVIRALSDHHDPEFMALDWHLEMTKPV